MLNKTNRILLNLTALASSGGPADPATLPGDSGVDPLAVAAGDVDTSMPLLMPDKLYNMEAKADLKTNDKGVSMVKITLKTTIDATGTMNEKINKGFPVFENFVFTPTGDLTIDQIKKSGANIMNAFGLQGMTLRDFVNNPSIIDGKIACVKIKTRKERDGYPASSAVASWVPFKAQ